MLDRLNLMLTKEQIDKISNLNILIIGVGGVGGYALESLVRTGVKKITIVDGDIIEESNLNRQIISINSNIGNNKVDAAKKRCLQINPLCNIEALNIFLDKSNIDQIDYHKYDFIIDACDTITTKVLLIKKAKDNNIDIISCMGTGNRLNPLYLKITKLSKTFNDPLAKVMRKLLKDNGIKDVLVCWSSELPIKNNSRTPGSAIFVPATAGLLISSYIIDKTTKDA